MRVTINEKLLARDTEEREVISTNRLVASNHERPRTEELSLSPRILLVVYDQFSAWTRTIAYNILKRSSSHQD